MKNKSRNEITKISKLVSPVLKSHNVTRAGIFGSYARGEQKKNSDIDLLVKINQNWGLIEVIRLKGKIEKKTKRKIDLVEYDTIRPEMRRNILAEEIPIKL